MRTVDWTPEAKKDLRPLDRKTQERIRQAVYRLAETGHGDLRWVKERPGEQALRLGDWRIFFRTLTEEQSDPPGKIDVLRILRIRSRGHAYGR